jgi:hypothetical protein
MTGRLRRAGRPARPGRLGRPGRLVSGTAAWAAGTAIAVTLAWLGAQVVLRDAVTGGQQAPVLGAGPPTSRPAGSPSPGPRVSSPPSGTPSPRGPGAPGAASPAPAPGPSRPAPSPGSGVVHSYALTGGRVTLLVAATSVQLVDATPAAGFSVQTWSAAGWLRVDFSEGSDVSSLIATWNSRAPTVQIFND